jgi:hypothetical protein
MATRYDSVLAEDELALLTSLPEVQEARSRLGERSQGQIYFSLTLPESIKASLGERLGLDLSAVSQIPMRWLKGDTAPHIDVGRDSFETTYLVYLNSSEGQLRVGDEAYPIEAGVGYSFPEGTHHEVNNTNGSERLVIGPMSEMAFSVGSAPLYYFTNQTDALNNTNQIAIGNALNPIGTLDSGSIGSYTRWRIAANSTGTSPQNVVYTNGEFLANFGDYYLYPAIPCFLKGSTILCQVEGKEMWLPVEDLRKGTLVKTSRDGYKAVEAVGKGSIRNPGTEKRTENRLYLCSKAAYPELKTDLVLTGCHSILVDSLTDVQREATLKASGKVYVTDKKYRLMASLDERAVPWQEEGQHTIYHFALENSDIYMNYGVYANGGLLVETCSIRYLTQHANLKAL